MAEWMGSVKAAAWKLRRVTREELSAKEKVGIALPLGIREDVEGVRGETGIAASWCREGRLSRRFNPLAKIAQTSGGRRELPRSMSREGSRRGWVAGRGKSTTGSRQGSRRWAEL